MKRLTLLKITRRFGKPSETTSRNDRVVVRPVDAAPGIISLEVGINF